MARSHPSFAGGGVVALIGRGWKNLSCWACHAAGPPTWDDGTMGFGRGSTLAWLDTRAQLVSEQCRHRQAQFKLGPHLYVACTSDFFHPTRCRSTGQAWDKQFYGRTDATELALLATCLVTGEGLQVSGRPTCAGCVAGSNFAGSGSASAAQAQGGQCHHPPLTQSRPFCVRQMGPCFVCGSGAARLHAERGNWRCVCSRASSGTSVCLCAHALPMNHPYQPLQPTNVAALPGCGTRSS